MPNRYYCCQLEEKNTQYHDIDKILFEIYYTFYFPKFRIGKFFRQVWENFEEDRIRNETDIL